MNLGLTAISWQSGFTIPYSHFPRRAASHLAAVQNTQSLEASGSRLRLALNAAALDTFIGDVCRWGGYAGIAGRIRKNNAPALILSQFQSAISNLNRNNVQGAIQDLNLISGLGTPSFASKHLRFLAPELAGVLDRLVHDALQEYLFDSAGFQQYCSDFAIIANHVNVLATQNNPLSPTVVPHRPNAQYWLPSDCDMVIFATIQGF